MKQKDKKLLQRKSTLRLHNTEVQGNDFYDEISTEQRHKSKRTGEKSQTSLKNDLSLQTGRVTEVMSNYSAIVKIGEKYLSCSVGGRLKQYSYTTKKLLAVGDYVEVDFSKEPYCRIENILPRHNSLSRFTESGYQKEIIVASNIDNLVITVSWLMPMLKPGLIDRYLCMAAIYHIHPIVCVNKIDLCEDMEDAREELSYYRELDIPVVFTSATTGQGIEELRDLLKNKDSVFSGQSGTGKSSLMNALEPGLELLTDEVSDYNEKGRHTTTASRMIAWSFGGNLIDTPGLKTITLHKEQKNLIPTAFPGFAELAKHCRYRSCTHRFEEDCAVLKAVEDDSVPIERYDSYTRIMDSL